LISDEASKVLEKAFDFRARVLCVSGTSFPMTCKIEKTEKVCGDFLPVETINCFIQQ